VRAVAEHEIADTRFVLLATYELAARGKGFDTALSSVIPSMNNQRVPEAHRFCKIGVRNLHGSVDALETFEYIYN
jgi:hypothetical protein